MQNPPRRFRQALIAHRAVGSAEINCTLQDLLLTGPGADGLIIEMHGRIDFAVFIKPLGINGVGKSGARAVDEKLGGEPVGAGKGEREQEQNSQMFLCFHFV